MYPTHPEGNKLIFLSAAIFVLLGIAFTSSSIYFMVYVALCLLILCFLSYFFRDPHREINKANDNYDDNGKVREIVLAPSDGKVLRVGARNGARNGAGPRHRVFVYLSPFDVHVNRIPCDGIVTKIEYHPGTFSLAWTEKASHENESCMTEIKTQSGDLIRVRQIAGRLARQIVNSLKVGQRVKRGERFGIIRFGSQVEISLPSHLSPLVKSGNKVIAGITRIA